MLPESEHKHQHTFCEVHFAPYPTLGGLLSTCLNELFLGPLCPMLGLSHLLLDISEQIDGEVNGRSEFKLIIRATLGNKEILIPLYRPRKFALRVVIDQ